MKDRNGSVLGKGSILKMYFFPGQRTSSYIQIHGAPHVYKVSWDLGYYGKKQEEKISIPYRADTVNLVGHQSNSGLARA